MSSVARLHLRPSISSPKPLRRGLTLVEVLVVVSMIAIIVGLILPAIQSAREASARARCSHNLRQIGLAIHAYHDAFDSLPPGRFPSYDPRYAGANPPCTSRIIDKGFLVMILPGMEQRDLYNAINQSVTIFGRENTTASLVAVDAYACPSDPDAGRTRPLNPADLTRYGFDPGDGSPEMVFTSYGGSFGSLAVDALPSLKRNCVVPGPLKAQADGAFTDVAPIRFASITDGLSSTILVAEKSTTALRGLDAADPAIFDRYGWYVSGNLGDSLVSAMYPPNMFRRVSYAAGASHAFAATSLHPGGLNALLGDGSVRFVKETIDSWPFDPITGRPAGATLSAGGWWVNLPRAGVWQALATRAGGETVGEAF